VDRIRDFEIRGSDPFGWKTLPVRHLENGVGSGSVTHYASVSELALGATHAACSLSIVGQRGGVSRGVFSHPSGFV
jgi:hypothetical protein